MKGFLFDCTASLGDLHRKTYHITVFSPEINAESEKFLLFPVQYYRRFFILNFPQKNRWFIPNCCTNQNLHKNWIFEVKTEKNLSKSGLYQNVIKTSFYFQKLRYCSQRKLFTNKNLTKLLFYVIMSMLNMSMMIIVVL